MCLWSQNTLGVRGSPALLSWIRRLGGWAPGAPGLRSQQLYPSALAKSRPSLAFRVKAGNQREVLTPLGQKGATRSPCLPSIRMRYKPRLLAGSRQALGSNPNSSTSIEQEGRERSLQKAAASSSSPSLSSLSSSSSLPLP